MIRLPDELPIVILLAVLVGIFVSVQRNSPSPRVKIWTYAWALAFLHFFARVFETHTGLSEKLIESVDLAGVQLSGIIFLSSVAFDNDDCGKRLRFSVLLAIPVLPSSPLLYPQMGIALGSSGLGRADFPRSGWLYSARFSTSACFRLRGNPGPVNSRRAVYSPGSAARHSMVRVG